MNESREIRNMRHMAWERAKGELRAMLHTFWSDGPQYNELKEAINDFIVQVEDDGLHE